tara:strand:- start:726 stop:1094 length:369 start_codon:yes stop_codon:yes gene_type:complete
MGIFTKLGIAAFIGANSRIFFRLFVTSAIIFICNLLYSKYEALLLLTDPEKLFIPLYIYTAVVISIIIWTLLSFRWFTTFRESKNKLEIKNSFKNKPDEYKKIMDVSKYPNLKTKTDKILSD